MTITKLLFILCVQVSQCKLGVFPATSSPRPLWWHRRWLHQWDCASSRTEGQKIRLITHLKHSYFTVISTRMWFFLYSFDCCTTLSMLLTYCGSRLTTSFPLVDIVWAMMIVWMIRGKIIRTVLCCAMYDSCAQLYARIYEQFLKMSVGLAFVRFSILCFFLVYYGRPA